jgi:very-short-patch-repair endonuclease
LEAIKNKALCGRKFRRQYSIGKFILDFYCAEERLGIELDGTPHFVQGKMEYDKMRTEAINNFNIKIIRFENFLVMEDIEKVLEVIKSNFKHATPCPPKLGGE